MSAAAKWTAVIVGLLGANVLGMIILITASHRSASRVIPNYYERGVHYDDEIDQAAADRRLGWHVDLAVAGGVATVTARDVTGTPLAGATVRLDGAERATGAARSALLAETAPGVYRAPLACAGWLDLAISVEHGGAHYVAETAAFAR